jgi:hypothetical protein
MCSEDNSTQNKDEHYKYVLQRCEEFAKERETAVASLLSVSERFDKWVIGLPAGAAGLSMVFYEKVVAKAQVTDLSFLAISWIFLSIAIGLGFLSLYLSTLAVQRQIVIQDEEHKDFVNTSTPEKLAGIKRRKVLKNQWAFWTGFANLFSVITCLVGVCGFLYFAYHVSKHHKIEENVTIMSDKDKNHIEKKAGFVPPKGGTTTPPPKKLIREGFVPPKSPPPNPPRDK